ncbi:TPA: hypothetical protein ACH3X2_010532 [Trebouxia sp. C0005]
MIGPAGLLQNGAGSASMMPRASEGTGSFPVIDVTQEQTTDMNYTAAQEDTVQISAAGYDNPAGQQPAGSLGQALRGPGLPMEEEVKMFLQIVKSFPDPRKLPDFMKRRGKQSRPVAIKDFVKPSA